MKEEKEKAKGERKKQKAREASKKRVSDQRQQRDNSSFPVLRQVSVWCACGCEQRRQQVRHKVGHQQHQGLNPRETILVPSRRRLAFKAARGCTAGLGAGDGRDTHARISGRFRFTDDFLVSETILPPLLPPE